MAAIILYISRYRKGTQTGTMAYITNYMNPPTWLQMDYQLPMRGQLRSESWCLPRKPKQSILFSFIHACDATQLQGTGRHRQPHPQTQDEEWQSNTPIELIRI